MENPKVAGIGMYVHQHWPYKRPYAARTWTLEDWRGYVDGLQRLGYNTILIWPMIETMPEPLTRSDRDQLLKLGKVIDMIHTEFGMRVNIVLCPNIIARNAEAAKATFQTRHYYYCEDLVNPADPVALDKMIRWREKLIAYIKNVDGVTIIDSDPGGYPGSPISEFTNLLNEHRKMLSRLRPEIELIYWMHAGWRGWGRFYEKGRIVFGTPEESLEALCRLKEYNPEPWGIANGLPFAQQLGLQDKVMNFNYGRIEGEPSFPMTNFTLQSAMEGAKSDAPRGVMGNAQTHCVQLPNTFAFARGAQGLPVNESDIVQFANDLIAGQGETIVAAWKLIPTADAPAMRSKAQELDRLARGSLRTGPLKGLLFGSPKRFLTDLAMMLRQRAAIEELAVVSEKDDVRPALRQLLKDAGAWQARHGYQNNWYDPKLHQALRKLNSRHINAALQVTYEIPNVAPSEEGTKAVFERVRQNFASIETYTSRLMEAMKETLRDMDAAANP